MALANSPTALVRCSTALAGCATPGSSALPNAERASFEAFLLLQKRSKMTLVRQTAPVRAGASHRSISPRQGDQFRRRGPLILRGFSDRFGQRSLAALVRFSIVWAMGSTANGSIDPEAVADLGKSFGIKT